MGLGQQPDNSNYDYMDQYSKKKMQDQNSQFDNLTNQASVMSQTGNQLAGNTDTSSPWISPQAAQGFARGQSGGIGSGLMSAGIASSNPYLAAGGLGMMALEGNAQGRQKEQEAQQEEAQQRKQAQLSSINQLIAVSKGLTVGV